MNSATARREVAGGGETLLGKSEMRIGKRMELVGGGEECQGGGGGGGGKFLGGGQGEKCVHRVEETQPDTLKCRA